MRIIAGTARSRIIQAPAGKDTRPTLDRVRENLFNILQHRVYHTRVLDLFAGSGALALEAISRGASMAVMVDHDRAANVCEQKNTEALHFTDQVRMIHADWRTATARLVAEGAVFDLIFLDPPYTMNDLTAVTDALKPLLAPDTLLVVEHASGKPALVGEGWQLQDTRKYGYVGISFYQYLPAEKMEDSHAGNE